MTPCFQTPRLVVAAALLAWLFAAGCGQAVNPNLPPDGTDGGRADGVTPRPPPGSHECHQRSDCGALESCVFAPGCSAPSGTCQFVDPLAPCEFPVPRCDCHGTTTIDCIATEPFARFGLCESTGCTLPDGASCAYGATCTAGPANCPLECSCHVDGTLACRPVHVCTPPPPPPPPLPPGACRSADDCTNGQQCHFPLGCGREGTIGRCGAPSECPRPQTFCSCDLRTSFTDCDPTQPAAHEGSCEGVDAGNPPPDAPDCDARRVLCEPSPPACPPGSARSFIGCRHSLCVPLNLCRPIRCDPAALVDECPAGLVCSVATRFCFTPGD